VPETQHTAPQAVITNIATEALGETVRVVVHATAPLQYTAFKLHDPLRLVIDIPEARFGELPQPPPVAGELVSRIEPQALPDMRMVRVLIYLRRMVAPTIDVQGPQLHITLREAPDPVADDAPRETPASVVAGSAAPPLRPIASADEASLAHQTLVTDISYAVLPDKTVVSIQTVGEPPQVRVQQHQEPVQLSLDIAPARLHANQEKTLLVSGAPGVLTQLRAFPLGEDEASAVRIVANLRVATPFEVHQDGNVVQLLIANTPVAAMPAAPVPLPRPPGGLEKTPPAPLSPRLIPTQLAPLPMAPPAGSRKPPIVRTEVAAPVPPPAPSAGGAPTPGQASAAPEELGARYTGVKISLDFQNADINDILRLIAEVSGLNIIAGGDVHGTVTTRMVDVPWDQALDVILKINGLAQEREGNIIRVAPLSRFINERQESMKARQTVNEAEPILTQLVPINYANATDLKGNLEKLLSARGSIFIDTRTNTMIISDTRRNLDDILALVDTLDRQTPQVMIESRIVEASRTFTQELGVRFGGQYRGVTDVTFPNRVAISGTASDAPPGNFLVDLPAAVGVGSGGAIGFALAGASSLLNLEVSALERTGQGKTISNPRIATLDNTEAQILSGIRIPFATTSAEGTKTELVDASLVLKVTPHVTPDGFINLKITVTNNQPNTAIVSGGQPSITTREATTAMLVRDGDTVVIGGLYKRTFSTSRDGLPWLSQVPVLGWLFRKTQDIDNNEELLIFITPRIMRQPEEPGKARAARSS
jgi:type IV pilus secretin PilQ/predicted competence protein